jgi:hypothetical protein
MSTTAPLQNASGKSLQPAGASLVLQRKCACGGGASELTGECEECSKKKIAGLQTKLRINEPGDIYEQEADRVAERVLAKPGHPDVPTAPLRVQRLSGQSVGPTGAAPLSVDRALAGPGRPLDSALRQDMERRFGHDFSRVRVHTDVTSDISARHVNAHAYAAGHHIVFRLGRFAPSTNDGRRLLAHELTHVIQQTQGDGDHSAASIQRDDTAFNSIPEPEDLVHMYSSEIFFKGRVDGIADRLVVALRLHSSPYDYVVKVLKAVGPEHEDEVGAAFVDKLTDRKLNQIAASSDGRSMLSILYEAIITGDVSEFEREQANRVLLAKARQYSPEDYARMSKERSGQKGRPTLIFPVRFMRVFGGDYAPPLAQLTDDGKVRVKYPVSVMHMDMFKEEVRYLPDAFFLGKGEDLNPNEIIGIKDYERGGNVLYLPALALIDYSNQAVRSTAGKILEVSIFAATLGFGSGAVVAEEATGEIAAGARWGARLAKGARALDRVANFIGVASFVINENRDWIISKFGRAGKLLVEVSDIANTVASIYGFARLAQAGYKIVKDLRAASKAVRAQGKTLTDEESAVLRRLDEQTDEMLKELDEEAAKSGRGAAPIEQKPSSAEKPVRATEEIDASATAHHLSPTELETQVGELERKAANPDNVRRPSDPNLDAEMTADGHTFERNKVSRTWCRKSPPPEKVCELNLGKDLNTKTDAAVAKREAKYAELEKQRKAREAAPPRARQPKKEPARKPSTDQPPEKGPRPAEEVKEPPQAKIDPNDPEALVKKSARDRAREETQKKIKEIEKQKARARTKIDKLKGQIDELNKKIERLNEEIRSTTDPQRAKALEKELKTAEYKLNEEKGGGLIAEREGTIEELEELEKRKVNLTEALKLERPSLRESTKRAIEAKAPREETPPYRFLDRQSRPIDGEIHYGHKYGHEHRRLALEAQEKGMNQAQFNDWVNDHPEWFQIESAEENLSHQFEKRGID